MTALTPSKRLTLGFKVLSGYYHGRLARDDVDRLALDDAIPWNSMEAENIMNRASELLLGDSVFRFWASWHSPLIEVTSDAVALNFLLLTAKDWVRKGKPANPASATCRAFIKNARVILDRCVYEYVTKQWRGSGDSRIASNLEILNAAPSVLEPVSEARWSALVTEVLSDGTIDGRSYLDSVDKSVRLLLLYHYVLAEIDGPTVPDSSYDVDHIIPVAAFNAVATPQAARNRNHIVNLAFLPSKPNASKSDSPLQAITDAWLKNQVLKYELIPEADYPRVTGPESIDYLREVRGTKIKEALTLRRRAAVA